jgi:hypothetical protein
MQQSRQFADIMQLYSDMQRTYHSAMLHLLSPLPDWAGTMTGLAYVLVCDALGKEPQKELSSKLSLGVLTELVNSGLKLKGHSLMLSTVAGDLKDMLAMTGNKPINALVLPDLLTLMMEGTRSKPLDIANATGDLAEDQPIEQACAHSTEEAAAEVRGLVRAELQDNEDVNASRDAMLELLLSALRFAAPPVHLGAGVDSSDISMTLAAR